MNRNRALALALVGVVAGCANGDDPQQMHGTLERDRLELVAEAHERIVDIAVREGDRVEAGAVLLRQEAGTMQPRLDQARAALAQAERRLADAVQGPRQREIDEAQRRWRARRAHSRPSVASTSALRHWSSAGC